MFTLARFIYALIFYAALPFVFLRLWIKGIALPMYRSRYQERLGIYRNKKQNDAVDIWIHAVSLGEVIAITPLVESLLRDNYALLMTTMTPTGAARVAQQFADRVQHCYIPYDIPYAVQRFYRHFSPKIALIVETEIWPNLLLYAKKQGVQLFLCNARLSQKSYQSYQKFAWFFKPVLKNFSGIYSQSKADASRFIALGADPEHVHAWGNIKFDLTVNTVNITPYQTIRALWQKRLIVIVASTHDDEELQILTVWRKLLTDIPDALLLIAPRHPERFDKVYHVAVEKGFTVGLRSKPESLEQQGVEVVVLDCLGELLGFYAISDYSFVGGSLVPHGGHNVLEPIAMQVPVITGAHYFNFEYICDVLQSNQGIIVVQSADELIQTIISLEKNPENKRALCQNAGKILQDNKGALDKYRALVQQQLSRTKVG